MPVEQRVRAGVAGASVGVFGWRFVAAAFDGVASSAGPSRHSSGPALLSAPRPAAAAGSARMNFMRKMMLKSMKKMAQKLQDEARKQQKKQRLTRALRAGDAMTTSHDFMRSAPGQNAAL